MSAHVRDPWERPPLTEDVLSSYLHARGDVAAPDGILTAAREQALRPVTTGWPRPLVFGVVTAVVVLAAALMVATLPSSHVPMTPMAGPVAPARTLLLATYHDSADGGEVLLRPADPATALPLEGFEPLAIAQPFEPHLSPDGRTLAIMTWLSDAPGTGTLRLIDLASWTITETPVTGLVDFRGVTWTPDSRALVWLAPTETSATLPVGRAFEVMRWSVGHGPAERLVSMPDRSLRPWDARMSSRSTLVVVGQSVDAQDLPLDAPRVLSVDLAQPRVIGDVALTDLALGDEVRPAVAWDLPRQRLFVATLDRLVTVGLPGLDVAMLPIVSAAGTSDAPPTAVLSGTVGPDGERLYLTGITQPPTASVADRRAAQASSPGPYVSQPVGLHVVDTSDGTLAAPIDPSVGQLVLSPSGDRLVLVGWTTRTLGDGTSSIRVVEPSSLDLVARMPPIEGATSPYPVGLATSWDGKHGYIVTNVQTDDSVHAELAVLDLADGRVVSRPQPDPAEPTVSLLALGGS